jgi:hypothetical protein
VVWGSLYPIRIVFRKDGKDAITHVVHDMSDSWTRRSAFPILNRSTLCREDHDDRGHVGVCFEGPRSNDARMRMSWPLTTAGDIDGDHREPAVRARLRHATR